MDIKSIPARWVEAWSSDDPKPWVDMYTTDAVYIDHAFQSHRSGHKVLTRHHGLWRTANPDFSMTLVPDAPVWWSADTDVSAGNGTCSFRTINKGTFKNDLLHFKPTGKNFEFRGVIDMVIEGGKIKQLNEYYSHRPFSDSTPIAEYNKLEDKDLP